MEWGNHLIKELQWSNKISNKASKELVAQEIVGLAKDGDVIGVGSGSTVYLTLFALAQRIKKESLHIEVIPASTEISMTCIQLGLPQTTLSTCPYPCGKRDTLIRSFRNLFTSCRKKRRSGIYRKRQFHS